MDDEGQKDWSAKGRRTLPPLQKPKAGALHSLHPDGPVVGRLRPVGGAQEKNESVEQGTPVLRDGMITNSLRLLGVVGLRTTDLMLDNLTCCGDCRNVLTEAQGPFTCHAGYPTTLYSIKAIHCPDFASLEALSEEPQGDERTGDERRAQPGPVPVDRRTGDERRLDPDQWTQQTE